MTDLNLSSVPSIDGGPCPACGGAGRIDGAFCSRCKGDGSLPARPLCERGCGLAFVSLAWPGEGKRRALCLRHGAEVVRAADALQVPREQLAVCIFGRDGELIPWPRPT